ncbi:NDP-hexose 2,3-dehydratase family protein [Saprospiraceae bacterium]|nr:NDP-hexose 2,3-dehydratase family protein [Saprospiraceae bacterium]
MGRKNFKFNAFLKSALTTENPYNSTSDVLAWLQKRNAEIEVEISRIEFSKLKSWGFKNGGLRHNSGRFFSIEGVEVEVNRGDVTKWNQPVINQPEIGILGIITKEVNGVLYFLMQSKIEPGNVNYVQLSPTIQATKSNYTQVHKGKKPQYLEYFLNDSKSETLLDQLQSEQGARFLRKRNRNIIIKVNDEIKDHPDFRWLTLGQIKELMQSDNVVNMDSRTVISGITFGNYDGETVDFYSLVSGADSISNKLLSSELDNTSFVHSFDDILHWFTRLKTFAELSVIRKNINQLDDWVVEKDIIRHKDNKYFSVIGVNVNISNREVVSWDQPLIKPSQEGLCAFVIKEINGRFHFLVQAKMECGNFDVLEMAPTVQCLTGNYNNPDSIENLPFLNYVLSVENSNILYDTLQSEEGGRFYREQNRNLIILADSSFNEEIPENYIWLTLNQLKTFIKFNNYLNIQARSLLSMISYIKI